MRPWKTLIFAGGLLFMSSARLFPQTGMLFGESHAFFMTAPEGWVLDNKSGVNQDLHMAFYPRGFTLRDSPVIAYGRSAALDGDIRTIEDLVRSVVRQFKDDGNVNISARKEKTVAIPEGKEAEVYFFRGDRWGNYEAVGYIREMKTINFLVFSSRGEKAFVDNIGKFYEILTSYKNAYREDPEDYDEGYFRRFLEQAEEDKSTPAGKAYEELLAKTQAKELFRLFQECLEYRHGDLTQGDLDAVFIVDEDGTIGDSYVWPVTSLGVCFKSSTAVMRLPRHGLKRFHWHVSLRLTEEGRIAERPPKEPDPSDAGAVGLGAFRVSDLPSNPFSIAGYYNPYDYWSRFKPGTSVVFKIVSEAGESKTTSVKRFELKQETPEKILIRVRSSFDLDKSRLSGASLGKDEVSDMVLEADALPWRESDLFSGYLSLNFSDPRLFLDANRVSSAKETVDVNGRVIAARRFTMTFEHQQAETIISIWYSGEIPGGIARYTREISAPGTSVHEEILVEDFKAAKKSEEELQRPGWMARATIPASTYLGKKLRYFEHERVIEGRLLTFLRAVDRSRSLPDLRTRIEDTYRTWLPYLETLVEDAGKWKREFEEDRESIRLELPETEMAKLEPFLDKAARHCQAVVDDIRSDYEFFSRLFGPKEKRDLAALIAQRSEEFRGGTGTGPAAREEYVAARDKLKDIRVQLK